MKRSARTGRARVAGASGQALVPALIFLLVGGIGLYIAFNSFQMTSAKIKLQNTADAAAYTAAVLQARDYNFSAYTNRAMVANQVTAAQIVGLKSWIDELDSTYSPSQLDDLINVAADHPDRWNSPKKSGKSEIAPVRATLDAFLPSLAVGIGSITRALSVAQANYHTATFTAVPEAANTVATQNQPDTHVTAGFFSNAPEEAPAAGSRSAAQFAAWQSYTVPVDPAGSISSDRFADVVTNAVTLDPFTKDRDSSRSANPYQYLDDGATRICGPGSHIAVNVTHDGGTQLRNDKTGWEAIDASTAHVTITCIGALDAEAGSGAAVNGDITSFMSHPPFAAWQDWQGYGDYFNFGFKGSSTPGWHVPDAMAEQFSKGPGASLDPVNGGLMPYQDMNGTPIRSTAPRITVEVERRDDSLVKTRNLQGGGEMKIQDNAAHAVIRTLASANAYFARPNEGLLGSTLSGALLHPDDWSRDDGKTEYPSLFSPYWQAALAPVGVSERSAADAAQISAGAAAQKP